MTSNRKRKKRDKKLLAECWILDYEPNIKHYSRAYKHSHKYYAKCQKRYDGFSSIIKAQLVPHIFLQHPKVAYVIDKKDLVNPNGLFSIKDYLGKQEI